MHTLFYLYKMKYFNWDTNKNDWLKKNRNICFDDIVFYISKNLILDIIKHPNRDKYPNQKIFIIEIADYIYLVPFVENEQEIFLKTIIPSRKATKKRRNKS